MTLRHNLKPHKYNAKPTEYNGVRYDSKREARYAAELDAKMHAGEVVGWLRQIGLHLPGRTRYIVDFMVFYADGRVQAVDVKGMETPMWRLKMRQAQECYPWLPIEVVK